MNILQPNLATSSNEMKSLSCLICVVNQTVFITTLNNLSIGGLFSLHVPISFCKNNTIDSNLIKGKIVMCTLETFSDDRREEIS